MTSPEPGASGAIGGRYRLVSMFGSGGSETTWLARDEVLDVVVVLGAVQLPRNSSPAAASEVLLRAQDEARKAANLNHPGVRAVREVVVDGGNLWTATEFLEGESLERRIQDHGPLAVQQVQCLAEALLEALRAAHTAGVVHGDIRPTNVTLTVDGKAALVGFANVLRATAPPHSIVGTPGYMAPELVDGGTDGTPGDLFSLGVTLYQAVEGVSPFYRGDTLETLMAVMQDEPAPAQHAGALTPLITALLAKNPSDRPTVDEALAIVHGIVSETNVPRPEVASQAEWSALPPRTAGRAISNVFVPGPPVLLALVALVAGLGLLLVAGEPLWRTISGAVHGWRWWSGLLGVLWIGVTARGVRTALRSHKHVLQREATGREGARTSRNRRARSFWEGFTDVGFFSDVRSLVPASASRTECLRAAYNDLGPPPGMPPSGPPSLRRRVPPPSTSGRDREAGER